MTTKKSQKSDSAKSEVRISVSDQARELTIEVFIDREEVLESVKKALSSNEPLVLSDVRGRNFLIPSNKISSVEVGDIAERRVGFAGL
jgi:hypothetical protein